MDNGRTKVLYIVGLGRSGSTILSNSLGQIEGFFSAGEICYIWRQNFIENRLCGCGRPFDECPVWTEVVAEAFPDGVAALEMMRLQAAGARTRHIPLMLSEKGTEIVTHRLGKWRANTGRLYGALQSVTNSRVIVDSSKEPAYGYALSTVPGVDFRVLHLVRDPRAAAYSWLKKKHQPDSEDREFMHRFSPTKSAALWDTWNTSAETLWRGGKYLRLHYEDFVYEPRKSFGRILDLLDEDAELPLAGEREVMLGISHTVSGNPNRFDTGSVALKPDRAWTKEMNPKDRNLVTALTLPLLYRYGYPVTPKDPIGRPAARN
ncbi:MAG: sulfotransferase [Rubrobacteraceae bacterium]